LAEFSGGTSTASSLAASRRRPQYPDKVTVETPPRGDYRRTHLISLIDSVCDKIVAKGVLAEAKLKEHRQELAQHLKDAATVVIDKLLVQCWGQKSD
jgi:hypothetical protein